MPPTDPAHDIFRTERRPLDAVFRPRTVAVIGATESADSVGRSLLWNLISHPFGGTVYPVNPKRAQVLGIRAYPDIASVPERVDLAVIATPAPAVPDVVRQCAEVGVSAAIVISAGFKERGPEGAALEQQTLDAARGKLRLIGPNCLGVMRPVTGLNATFAQTLAQRGNVAFISQSGALCTAVLDWSLRENVGFSAFVSIGSAADVGWGDLIDYLGDDPHTKSIVLYMESIGDARAFLSAAREVALTKPIILLKAGRSEQAAKAAASHTGALAGSDAVLDAACRRTGVLRVEMIAELFYMAEILAQQPQPKGPHLSIITNAGGPGVLATDALVRNGGELTELEPQTIDTLNSFLPEAWSHGNPIDVLGDADPTRYRKAVEAAAADSNSDGLLVMLTPQAMTDPLHTAEEVRQAAANFRKPILASWMGGDQVEPGRTILSRASIPTLPYPDTAARLFSYMWQYTYNLRGIYETPALAASPTWTPARDQVEAIIADAQRDDRHWLTEAESKRVLDAYGIPTVQTDIARSEDEAVAAAERIGFPVVLKLLSETITHKSDVGGVRLNLDSVDNVRHAYRAIESNVRQRVGEEHFHGVTVQPMVPSDGYELILGSSKDPQFGPVLLFGSGGVLVEVYEDRALALPPLTTTLARRMIEQTRIYTALQGTRGRESVDLAQLEKMLVRFGQLVLEQPRIAEIDINPLLASSSQLLALDARVALHPADVADESLPRPAIRPYPSQHVARWSARDDMELTIRPIRPEDEPALVRFHQQLS
ncbi:MAG: acetate--CoA ligase family protein, partial [Phycisphaeraceae bacterium]